MEKLQITEMVQVTPFIRKSLNLQVNYKKLSPRNKREFKYILGELTNHIDGHPTEGVFKQLLNLLE